MAHTETLERQHTPEALRDFVVTLLDDRSGMNLLALDVREASGFTDYMIIVTGTSPRHVKTLANHVMEETKARGFERLGVEGLESLDWVLIDLADVVVHVMRESTRKYYDLERMWTEVDAVSIDVPDGA
ncbi:MAG: ribosome silencing factor [Gammaproteobacteria bacterium]|nr:ribosome silencing factor [Gammaproteobacteria bacterium]